ncbi:MAG: c-type cytochrome [Myxococcales bacterium]
MRRLVSALAVVAVLVPAAAFAEVDVEGIWKKKCAQCHGNDGAAKTKMGEKYKVPDMTTAEWHAANSEAAIKDAIVNGGKTKMPAWKDKLSTEEIDALVKYVRAMKK